MHLASEAKTREILKKVRQIEIRTRSLIDEALCGAYHSVFKGQGIHFEEVREYNPGDEVRFIDWNVTAKMDRPFLKVFQEERELTLIVAIDISKSGNFGSSGQSKRELAAELAGLLAFSAARNKDKVGLLLFSDKVERFVPPQKGSKHLLRIIRDSLFFEATHAHTNIPEALRALSQLQKRKAIIFLLSDFIDATLNAEPNHERLLKSLAITSRRHDLICALITDLREKKLPNVGYIALKDAETGQTFFLNTASAQMREAYQARNEARIQSFKSDCRRLGIDLLEIGTDSSYTRLLQSFFNARIRFKK